MDKPVSIRCFPDYMTMGRSGMGEMGDMGMPVPKNSIPMLGGKGQFGPIDMGGMFTLVKVREDLNGYDDPGDYKFPPEPSQSPRPPTTFARWRSYGNIIIIRVVRLAGGRSMGDRQHQPLVDRNLRQPKLRSVAGDRHAQAHMQQGRR